MNSDDSNSVTPLLTELINRYMDRKPTKSELRILKIGYNIITKQKIEFSFHDFEKHGIKKGNFRQYVRKLRSIIYLVYKSNCGFYALKGIKFSKLRKKITDRGMGVGTATLEETLSMLQHLPPQLHNIRIKFSSKNLHKIFCQHRKLTPMKKNNQILLEYPYANELEIQRILCQISPESVQIMIAATYQPIYCDPEGILELTSLLGHLRDYLLQRSDPNFAVIPNVLDWIVSSYHFNKDGISRSGQTAEITVFDFDSIMMRFYTKTMPDGTKKDRLEAELTPNILVKQLFRKTLGLDSEKTNVTININSAGFTTL